MFSSAFFFARNVFFLTIFTVLHFVYISILVDYFYITQFYFFIKKSLFFLLSENHDISLHQFKYIHFHTLLYCYDYFCTYFFIHMLSHYFSHCIIMIGILYYYITLSHVFLSKLPMYIFIIKRSLNTLLHM